MYWKRGGTGWVPGKIPHTVEKTRITRPGTAMVAPHDRVTGRVDHAGGAVEAQPPATGAAGFGRLEIDAGVGGVGDQQHRAAGIIAQDHRDVLVARLAQSPEVVSPPSLRSQRTSGCWSAPTGSPCR